MLTTSNELAEHLALGTTTIATCWRIERTDGQVFGFTSLDVDIAFEGVRYEAETGILPSAISTRSGLQVDNTEAQGFLASDAITEADLMSGLWDHAELRIFQVNYNDLSQGALRLRRGWLGEVNIKDGRYTVEAVGLTAALNVTLGELVTPACAAELGDARCTVDMTPYTAIGTTEITFTDRVFNTNLYGAGVFLTPGVYSAPDTDYFAGGRITWLTGANAGLSEDVREYTTGGLVSLQLPMPNRVQTGDTFTITAGCSKAREGVRGCIAGFGNIINFRGFPDLPGLDRLLRIGGQ